jgi:hypothetical protein
MFFHKSGQLDGSATLPPGKHSLVAIGYGDGWTAEPVWTLRPNYSVFQPRAQFIYRLNYAIIIFQKVLKTRKGTKGYNIEQCRRILEICGTDTTYTSAHFYRVSKLCSPDVHHLHKCCYWKFWQTILEHYLQVGHDCFLLSLFQSIV